MKNFSLLLLLISLCATPAYAGIQGASNIASQKVVLNVLDEDSNERALVLMNLQTTAYKKIKKPSDLESEEVMGMVLFKDHLLMISQWTTGGGKNPKVHQYSLKSGKWTQPIEVDCLSFDTVEIKKTALRFHCEDKGTKTIKLGFKAPKAGKFIFPIRGDSKQGVQFRLSGGAMFDWEQIEVKSHKKKPMKAFKASVFFKNEKSKKQN